MSEIEDLKISDMTFSDRFKVIYPFIIRNRIKYCLNLEYNFRAPEENVKAQSIVHEFLTFYKNGRQRILKFRNFFSLVNTIRDRAILQIRLYREVVRDVTSRMSYSINLLTNRIVENENLKLKYPFFLDTLDSISEIAKM